MLDKCYLLFWTYFTGNTSKNVQKQKNMSAAPQKHCFGSGSFYLVSFLLNLIEGHHFDLLKKLYGQKY